MELNSRFYSFDSLLKRKREEMGLNSDFLMLKPLRKFDDLTSLSYPKRRFFFAGDVKKRFNKMDYFDPQLRFEHGHSFYKVQAILSKKIYKDLTQKIDGMTLEGAIEVVNEYIKSETYLDASVSLVEDELLSDFCSFVLDNRAKQKSQAIVQLNSRHNLYCDDRTWLVPLDIVVSTNDLGAFKGLDSSKHKGCRLYLYNLSAFIADGVLSKIVTDYLNRDQRTANRIKLKLDEFIKFEESDFLYTLEYSLTRIVQENGIKVPTFIKAILMLSLEEILQEVGFIIDYEQRVKSLDKSYAKSYMAKKNIPKKTQDFMENNNFLTMFDYVEVDESCDLESLRDLSEEFVSFSENLTLLKAPKYALRFRRLGNLKALGAFYPGLYTLAVDVAGISNKVRNRDGVSSFIHEWLHLLDYENGLVSLNEDFNPLLSCYRRLMDQRIHEISSDEQGDWFTVNKESRRYYRSNDEAFARMGEMYIAHVLNIKTSFNHYDYNQGLDRVVYPQDKALMNMIEDYYSAFFAKIQNRGDKVTFEKKTPVSIPKRKDVSIKKESSKEILSEKINVPKSVVQLSLIF